MLRTIVGNVFRVGLYRMFHQLLEIHHSNLAIMFWLIILPFCFTGIAADQIREHHNLRDFSSRGNSEYDSDDNNSDNDNSFKKHSKPELFRVDHFWIKICLSADANQTYRDVNSGIQYAEADECTGRIQYVRFVYYNADREDMVIKLDTENSEHFTNVRLLQTQLFDAFVRKNRVHLRTSNCRSGDHGFSEFELLER